MSSDRDDALSERPELERTREAGRSAYQIFKESIVAGLAVLLPILVTLLVLNAAAGYIFGTLDQLIAWLTQLGFSTSESTLIVRVVVTLLFVAVVIVVGFLTRFRFGEALIDRVDGLIQMLPGVGGVYKSFRQMGDVMLESEDKNFREVKMVEFPHEGAYTLGFLTTQTPRPLQEAMGRSDMVTLFLPIAPNPVMGGHLVHMPEDRVRDVDMSVEEAMRTVVTMGVATSSPDNGSGGLSERELRQMSAFTGEPYDVQDPEMADERGAQPEMDPTERREEYEQWSRPDDAGEDPRPEDVAKRQRSGSIGDDASHPEDVERGEGSIGRDDAHPEDVEDGSGRIGRDHARPDDVRNEHDGELGRAEDSPDELAREDAEALGDDAETPEDLDAEES
jgi:uncharacterized membrane protein